MRIPLTLCVAIILTATPALAQEFGRAGDIQTSGTSYHVFTRPGEATMQVELQGTVAQPGLYEVSTGISLGRLLTLAGGAPFTTPNPDIKRSVTVRVYRQQGGSRTTIYEAPYEEMLQEPSAHPTLQENDIVVVQTTDRQRFTWRNALSIVGSVAGVLLVVDRLFGIFPNSRN